MKSFLAILVVSLVSMSSAQNENPTIYLVGDSTMSDKKKNAYPETGWGMPFRDYFEETLQIENHARNGRSTRTFIEEGLWDVVYTKLKKGDYVFIQFGHNDEVQTKPRSTKPDEYKNYLRQYVNETRAKEAIPILLSPVTRRRFDENGNPRLTHDYSPLMRQVREELDVLFIDMDKKSIELMAELGEEKSALLFLHLRKGQNPNYPEGITDNTHFSETGARMIAELVIQGIKELNLDITKYLRSGG